MEQMKIEIKNIDVSKLCLNTGQIPDVPKNPRFIKDERFAKIKQSLIDDPEMMNLRELIVFPFENKFVVIGGNMRLRAGKELGYKEMPCKVLSADTPPEKLRAYVIKDNVAYGNNDFDLLANEWDEVDLETWGVEIDIEKDKEPEKKIKQELRPFDRNHILISYHPDFHIEVIKLLESLKEIPNIEIESSAN